MLRAKSQLGLRGLPTFLLITIPQDPQKRKQLSLVQEKQELSSCLSPLVSSITMGDVTDIFSAYMNLTAQLHSYLIV